MRVTIVTISYNQSSFLEQAVHSVISQSYRDIEYIVVDAGSTDGSRKIIEKYENNISRIIFETDRGPADGLNKGFTYATGKIFGFLNSDDLLLPGAIEKVVKYLKKNKDIDIVSGDALLIDRNGAPIRKLYSDKFSLVRYAYGAAFLAQQSTFFKSGYFKKVHGFNPTNYCAWDGELFTDFALAGGRFGVVRDFWSCFRSHSNSLTASARLDEDFGSYNQRIFKKIMGRPFRPSDKILSMYFRILKHLSNPRGVVGRITKGPVYGRYSR